MSWSLVAEEEGVAPERVVGLVEVAVVGKS
jgi:hypothetical protein